MYSMKIEEACIGAITHAERRGERERAEIDAERTSGVGRIGQRLGMRT